jgi:RHS repeat-associated protein
VPNIGGCNTTIPTASTLGGPAKYWQSYAYNDAGNRTNLTDHALDGIAAHDTSHTYTYTGATGTGGQPDAVQSITNSGPAGTTTDSYTYDNAGNTATRIIGATGSPHQTISYDEQGRTKTLTDSVTGNTAAYRYDADGNLLLQRDTKAGVTTVTLYLGAGEQLTLTTNTGAVNGLRYYPTPGGPTEIRSSTGTLTYEYANNQGTGEILIDAGSAQTQTRRYYTPYGQARGTTPTNWVDNRAFLNKPADAVTGLDLLGARNYDPATGHFLQRDPVQETADIGQLGGYTYAANNPVTGSDPTGTTNCVRIEGNDGPCASAMNTEAGKQQLANYEADQQRQEAKWAEYDRQLAIARHKQNAFNRRTGEDRIEAAAVAETRAAAAPKPKHWWQSALGAVGHAAKAGWDAVSSPTGLKWLAVGLSIASLVAGFLPLPGMSILSGALGLASAGAYWAAGDKTAAALSAAAAAISFIPGGSVVRLAKMAAATKIGKAALNVGEDVVKAEPYVNIATEDVAPVSEVEAAGARVVQDMRPTWKQAARFEKAQDRFASGMRGYGIATAFCGPNPFGSCGW